jgi:hypothetical protein
VNIHTQLCIGVTTVGVLGRLNGRLVVLNGNLALARTGLVVVVHSVAVGDLAGAHDDGIGVVGIGWEM